MNSSEFRSAAIQLIDYIIEYHENIRERPVLPSVQPLYIRSLVPETAPETGESWRAVFEDIEKVIMPGMTHWHSPRFHAYFPTASSFPAMLADMLSGALACIGFTWLASPACTELEMQMLDWLGKMLELPDFYLFSSNGKGGGVIQGTASESTLVALLGARSKILSENKDDATLLSKLVAYTSEQSHSSVERAALLGGVKMKLLPTDEKFSLRGDTLAAAIEKDRQAGLVPFFVVATLGTTNTCSFDNLLEIGQVCEKTNLWLHIDAAYAGASFICPEFRHYLNGVEYSDSLCMNPHKWLLVNFDCSTMWIKNRDYIIDSFNVNPVYLRHCQQGEIPDYRHWQIPLGRRFRSLKMWFVFRLYGVNGLQNYIRKHVQLAHEFEKLLSKDTRFQLVYPVICGLVCFRLKGDNSLNEQLVTRLNERKIIHLVPAKVGELFIIRFAICARTTELDDVQFSWNEICSVTEMILNEKKM